jgi:biopolymer transport protein ExbB
MKKLFSFLMILGVMAIGFNAVAQDDQTTEMAADSTEAMADDQTEMMDDAFPEDADYSDEMGEEESASFEQVVKSKFIEGDPGFMSLPLICLILGLAISIERIISLNLATTNTSKLLSKVEDALESGGVEAAKDVTRNTKGPVASIFTQGMMRMSEGIEMVEKSVIAYGSVEMGRLERGLVWISLFISLAPMLGFMGTVVGMIAAFRCN